MADASPHPRTYYLSAVGLMALLALTVLASLLQLGPFGVVVSLGIALTKAFIIAFVFMHVGYGSRLTKLFAAAGVFWIVILFALTFSDYATRF